jgi:hypothetical protein
MTRSRGDMIGLHSWRVMPAPLPVGGKATNAGQAEPGINRPSRWVRLSAEAGRSSREMSAGLCHGKRCSASAHGEVDGVIVTPVP